MISHWALVGRTKAHTLNCWMSAVFYHIALSWILFAYLLIVGLSVYCRCVITVVVAVPVRTVTPRPRHHPTPCPPPRQYQPGLTGPIHRDSTARRRQGPWTARTPSPLPMRRITCGPHWHRTRSSRQILPYWSEHLPLTLPRSPHHTMPYPVFRTAQRMWRYRPPDPRRAGDL